MPNTIEETYEYRVATVIKQLMKTYGFRPKNGDELFDWLEKPHVAESLGQALMADAMQWGGDENFWFEKVSK